MTVATLPTHPPTAETALPQLQSPLTPVLKRIPETSDDYGRVVVDLNEKWRVIECRDGVQWILQHRRRPPGQRRTDNWSGRSYCRTSEALIRCARDHAGEIDPAACTVLAALPARLNR